MSSDRKQTIKKIAEQIESYLLRHPDATDTLEGITKWWLTRQRFEEATTLVQKALDDLLSRGSIVQSTSADKQCLYRSTRKTNKSSTARQ